MRNPPGAWGALGDFWFDPNSSFLLTLADISPASGQLAFRVTLEIIRVGVIVGGMDDWLVALEIV